MGANMDPSLRQELESNGGTLTASLDDQGNITSARVSTGHSAAADDSQKIDTSFKEDGSIVKDHGVCSSEGPQADSMAGAANNHAAMHDKAENMIEAGLTSGDIGMVRQGAELWAKQLQDEKGIQTGAGVQEAGQSSLAGRAGIGYEPGKGKGGGGGIKMDAGASYSLTDTRLDSGTTQTSGYMNFVNQSAEQMMARYNEAQANGINADTAAAQVADDYLDGAAPIWVDNMAQRAYGAAASQTDELQDESVGEMAGGLADKAREQISNLGAAVNAAVNVTEQIKEVGQQARETIEQVGEQAEKSTLDSLLNLSNSMGGDVKPRD